MSRALADGNDTWAVVKGSAVNQDGRSSGLTAPNGVAQQEVLREAIQRSGVRPDHIGHVEAHGTGTPLGDPVEMDAIREVIGAPRTDGSRTAVTSVKTNTGHLEAAGGAGLIKAALSLRHQALPAHLHLHVLNPRINPQQPFRTMPGSAREVSDVFDHLTVGPAAFFFCERSTLYRDTIRQRKGHTGIYFQSRTG
ncbi:polyketide synthase [Streptomyces sp. DSM 41524]|uniref:Polyketide synthase n=1 Tax=Streptomyces asiaticus subsp. ignotus TaxID=3098222 RepID=A0ABU7Q9Z4_9ACTN|nr:polyketide synthase [Streptomyces sp. DSM 41524]